MTRSGLRCIEKLMRKSDETKTASYALLTHHRHLAPGGWIERIEVDVQVRCGDKTMPADSLLVRMHEGFTASTKNTGNTTNTTQTLRGMIESAGFINVHKI